MTTSLFDAASFFTRFEYIGPSGREITLYGSFQTFSQDGGLTLKVFGDQAAKPKEEIYAHRKGGMYRLLHREATREHDLEPVVVYQSITDGRIWTRPASEFFDGRFERIE